MSKCGDLLANASTLMRSITQSDLISARLVDVQTLLVISVALVVIRNMKTTLHCMRRRWRGNLKRKPSEKIISL